MEEKPLLPARMLNEYTYCPRLFYLEWVQGEFEDNADTLAGKLSHRRVDAREEVLAGPEAGDSLLPARSVMLSDEALQLVARIDLVEAEGEEVIPIDYKRGRRPDLVEGAWEPERVQLCAQGLLLRAHGYRCSRGILYFVESRQRVEIPFDEELVQRTLALRDQALQSAQSQQIPAPLVESPKCYRCSLAPICLPDEINLVQGQQEEEPRRILPARDDALPLVVQQQGASVGIQGERLMVRQGKEKLAEVRLIDVSDLSVFGAVQVTTQATRELATRGVPVSFFSQGGWFYGMLQGMHHKNIELRRAQFRAADNPTFCLSLARQLVETKIRNQRTLLRRNHPSLPGDILTELSSMASRATEAEHLESLLGIEGSAARLYFEQFGGMLKGGLPGEGAAFSWEGRNRRPPRDPVNAMLSFAYSLLVRDFSITLRKVGFDPLLGFYHQPRYGRPALALDLMEELRPLIADSVVLTVVNNGVLKESDFQRGATGVALKPRGRAAFLESYSRRMEELVTHPVFGYRISYRRVLEVQARLLARYLAGEIERYPGFRTR